MVTEVLCPETAYGYYAYWELDRLRHDHPTRLSESELQLICRLLAELHPASVSIFEEDTIIKALVVVAAPWAEIKPSGAEMIICEGQSHPMPFEAADGLKWAFFTDSRNPQLAAMWNSVEQGQLYRNPQRAVIAITDAVPRQAFEISF